MIGVKIKKEKNVSDYFLVILREEMDINVWERYKNSLERVNKFVS